MSGGADRVIKTWDIRFSSAPANTLIGHTFSVKRLKCHPHIPHVVGSVSHDKSAVIWDSRPLPYLTSWIDSESDPTHEVDKGDDNMDFQASKGNESVSAVNYGGRGENGGQEMASMQHAEYASGIDFSLFSPQRLATCGWDRQVHVWDVTPLAALVESKS